MPLERTAPDICLPIWRSNDGVHGTRLNPSSLSIMAKRPDAADALTVDTRDAFALCQGMIGQTGLRRDLCAGGVELTPAQRLKQIAYEDDALPLPTRKSFADQKFRTSVHGLAHLAAEAAVRDRCLLAGEKLAVEPGRTIRPQLRVDSEIRADGECKSLPPLGILVSSAQNSMSRVPSHALRGHDGCA
jgi:hypothetical protein